MAAERNIIVYQGDTYLHELRLRNSANANINIATRTYTGQIRKTKTSDSIVASFNTEITDGSNGIIQFSLMPEVTANIKSGVYYYDLQETNGTVVTTLLAGKATIQGEVTRVG
jgi:hypothetical protein